MNEQVKGNTMYERIPTVAELNRVAGFDPIKFARRIVQDGAERLQLDLKYKKLWFRLKYPQGRIKVTPLKITEQLAIIEAKVFFDRKDTAPTASFIAQRYAKDTPGGLYIESAQYVAADTALDDAGFGLQFVDAGALAAVSAQAKTDPVEKPVEAAVPPAAAPVAPAAQEQRLPKIEEPQNLRAVPGSTAQADADHAPSSNVQEVQAEEQPVTAVPDADTAAAEEMPQEQPVQVHSAAQEAAENAVQLQSGVAAPSIEEEPAAEDAAEAETARYTADMPVDDICALMTYEEARNIIVDVGTCKGWTLSQVVERRAASLKWYLNGYQGDNNVLKAGARLMLESLTMDRAS